MKHLKHPIFIKKVIRNLFFGLFTIGVFLGIGMMGYHYLENMSWLDAYLNASMILSGMGPADPLKTEAGKFFAGTYALFSGILFLFVIALILAPIIHRFLYTFHIDEK